MAGEGVRSSGRGDGSGRVCRLDGAARKVRGKPLVHPVGGQAGAGCKSANGELGGQRRRMAQREEKRGEEATKCPWYTLKA
eukprot:6172331-Pleurochrysis_carterae.AAC.1